MIPQALESIFHQAMTRLMQSKSDAMEKAASVGAIFGLQDGIKQALELPATDPQHVSALQVQAMTEAYLKMAVTVASLDPKTRLLVVAMFMILDGNQSMHETTEELKKEQLKRNHRSKAADDGVNYEQQQKQN